MNYMVRINFLVLLFISPLIAQNFQENNQTKNNSLLIIEDTSGRSETEVRQEAEKSQNKAQIKLHDVVKKVDKKGNIDLEDLMQKSWEQLSPTPKDGYDWIKLKHGDWLKGHIRMLYDDELEFETKEFGFYTFKLSKIQQIKSFSLMRVNIDNVAIFKGIIRYNDPTITIITGSGEYTFHKSMIISITSGKDKEIYNWAGDLRFSADIRKGNSNQSDYAIETFLERRTPQNRFRFDFLGRFSKVNGVTTAQDYRYNIKYDYFLTKKFFITPFFGEYYKNFFQNIQSQISLGSGIGYAIYHTPMLKWDISIGPAYLRTNYYQKVDNLDFQDGFALEINTKYEYKISKTTKIEFDYHFTFTQDDLGRYKHHTISTIENDIIKDRVYLDISFIWDYTKLPQESNDFLPQQNDFQTLIGGGVKF